jgi:hypothetical protein
MPRPGRLIKAVMDYFPGLGPAMNAVNPVTTKRSHSALETGCTADAAGLFPASAGRCCSLGIPMILRCGTGAWHGVIGAARDRYRGLRHLGVWIARRWYECQAGGQAG